MCTHMTCQSSYAQAHGDTLLLEFLYNCHYCGHSWSFLVMHTLQLIIKKLVEWNSSFSWAAVGVGVGWGMGSLSLLPSAQSSGTCNVQPFFILSEA